MRILLGKIDAEWQTTLSELACPENNLEIVGRVEDALDILLQSEELKPDAVVIAQLPGGGEPGVCSHLVLEHPNVPVLLLPAPSEINLTPPPVMSRIVLRKENWNRISKGAILAALKSQL
jgi:DNA-binding NarL/FixJ family response regulator